MGCYKSPIFESYNLSIHWLLLNWKLFSFNKSFKWFRKFSLKEIFITVRNYFLHGHVELICFQKEWNSTTKRIQWMQKEIKKDKKILDTMQGWIINVLVYDQKELTILIMLIYRSKANFLIPLKFSCFSWKPSRLRKSPGSVLGNSLPG